MKVLITSGGTKVEIDDVRSIQNMSKGTFGKQIAVSFLERDCDVIFLKSKGSRSPFKIEEDFYKDFKEGINKRFNFIQSYYAEKMHLYSQYEYSLFEEYEKTLFSLLESEKPDILVLAAAVSDYGAVKHKGKLRSSDSERIIQLFELPKLIGKVKEASSSFLVGFKLLVGSTNGELLQAMKSSMINNKCDMIVGNDLKQLKNNNHTLTLGYRDTESFEVYEKQKEERHLSDILADKIIDQYEKNK